MHLPGGSKGGPVFNFHGEMFGVASCSYDGAVDIALVTPARAILEIEVRETIGTGEASARMVSLGDIAARGGISTR